MLRFAPDQPGFGKSHFLAQSDSLERTNEGVYQTQDEDIKSGPLKSQKSFKREEVSSTHDFARDQSFNSPLNQKSKTRNSRQSSTTPNTLTNIHDPRFDRFPTEFKTRHSPSSNRENIETFSNEIYGDDHSASSRESNRQPNRPQSAPHFSSDASSSEVKAHSHFTPLTL